MGDKIEGDLNNAAIGINNGSYIQQVDSISELKVDGNSKLKIDNIMNASLTANNETGVTVEQHIHLHFPENADLDKLADVLDKINAKTIEVVTAKIEEGGSK